jgi:hypothetical protein
MKSFYFPKDKGFFLVMINLLIAGIAGAQVDPSIPHLQKQGSATQLIVDQKPFLILGGELGNSSSSSTEYMHSIWPTLQQMYLNTVIAPVYWELIEPEEGKFDFTLVNDLILDARKRNIRLVLLWFGSWKNSMSCYAPEWIKTNFKHYQRASDQHNNPVEILSPFVPANLNADKKAFTELMKFIKKVDGNDHTVIMIQVENEIGMLPCACDHHPLALKAYSDNVPNELIRYLTRNKEHLNPEFLDIWAKQGYKTSGNWESVFGKSISTDEIFQAWYFGKYTDEIAKAGKEVYPIPMYVNVALNRPGKLPGEYPSAGPLPHLMDIWKAAAPSIDMLSPDIYFGDLKKWCSLYVRGGNQLFIPEHRFDPSCGSKVFFVLGNHDGLGFSPFSIESTTEPQKEPVVKSYALIQQLTPLILEKQGLGLMKGFLLEKDSPSDTFQLGGYTIIAKHDYTLGWSPEANEETWPTAGGMIISIGEGEYFVVGNGIVLSFPNPQGGKTAVGIERIEEGKFVDGKWKPLRRLNGDQDHQGRHLRIPMNDEGIQYLKLYKYQ